MKKGSLLPLFFVVLTFVVVPLSFFIFARKNSNVRGASTRKDFTGVLVEIKSRGVWNLTEYLCTSVDECLFSMESGKKLKSLGGDKTESREVIVEYTNKMDEYNYIKIFVKTGLGLDSVSLNVEEFGGTTSASVHEIDGVNIVLIPLDSIRTGLYETVKFSD